jgi:hypothetical protein
VWGGLEVVEENGKLTARMGTESQLRGELVHWHYDTFRAHLGDGRSNPSWVRFVIDVDGRVTELRFGDGEGMVFTRAAEAPSSLP